MENEIVIEAPIEETPTAEAATEVLAQVAEKAIDETAERIEALVRATAEITGFRDDMAQLREAFRVAIEGNQLDFIAVREKLETLERGLAVMAETVARQEIEVDDIADEIEENGEVIAAAADVAIEGAADVAAAETDESPVLTPEIPEEHRTGKRRLFIRI